MYYIYTATESYYTINHYISMKIHESTANEAMTGLAAKEGPSKRMPVDGVQPKVVLGRSLCKSIKSSELYLYLQ